MDEYIQDRMLSELSSFSTWEKNKNISWSDTITKKMLPEYNRNQAKICLRINHNVSIYNGSSTLPLDDLLPPKFSLIEPLVIKTGRKDTNVGFFLYSSLMNIIVIVFSGTYNLELLLMDINYTQVIPHSLSHYKKGAKIHGGFYRLYSQIQYKILSLIEANSNENTQLILTGISLGGAISTIASGDLFPVVGANNLVHYSFASPKVWNDIGAYYYNTFPIHTYRIENTNDIIPKLPVHIMPHILDPHVTDLNMVQEFKHVDTLVYFTLNLGSFAENHGNSYLQFFSIF